MERAILKKGNILHIPPAAAGTLSLKEGDQLLCFTCNQMLQIVPGSSAETVDFPP